MSERYSTAGMYLCWATGTTRPSSGYHVIPEVKSIPSFNPAPEAIDSTTLLETEYRTYVEGLKSIGGALEFGANLTEDLITAWSTCNTQHDGMSAGTSMWFAVVHPKLTNAVYFKGDPAPLGLNEAAVGGMAETTLYITPNSAPEWAAKPTTTTT